MKKTIELKKQHFLFSGNFNIKTALGRGDGQVVNVLALYSDDLSSNPALKVTISPKNVTSNPV